MAMNEEMNGRLSFLDLPHHLSRLLGDPLPIRMGGATRHIHPPRLQLDEEERFHREEIAGKNLCFVVLHEMSPTGRWAALWRGSNAVSSEYIGNRLIADVIA